MKKLLSIGGIVGVALFALGCGASDADTGTGGLLGCAPGAVLGCACTDGSYGMQVCTDMGTLGPCGMCGNQQPIAPMPTAPIPTTPGTVAPVNPTPVPTNPLDPATPPPVVENPMNYPDCGSDPLTQPSPCIDAWGAVLCKANTPYPGNEMALCPMDPEEGMMLHFGPRDYDNPAEVDPYLLYPGEEREFCKHINTPNTTERWINSYHGRMRPFSHHLIVTMAAQYSPDDAFPYACSSQVLDRWLFGSQDPQIDVTRIGSSNAVQPGDPDYNLAQVVPANQTLLFDFHNLNATGEVGLREAWASFKYVDPSAVAGQVDMIAFYQLNISIPPLGHSVTQRKMCPAPVGLGGAGQPVYLGLATAHAHERMQRFSMWHHKNDGSTELIYETYDWAEPGNAFFTKNVENPPLPVPSTQIWGAKTGYVQVMPGESMSFECEFQNNLAQTVSFGDQTTDEMCNVFGFYYPTVGGMWNCFF